MKRKIYLTPTAETVAFEVVKLLCQSGANDVNFGDNGAAGLPINEDDINFGGAF